VAPAPRLDFWAERGGGAGSTIGRWAVSRCVAWAIARATGFPYYSATSPQNNFATICGICTTTPGIRRVGAAALDPCMVAVRLELTATVR